MATKSQLWTSVKFILDAMPGPRRLLDESDFVRSALRFANTGSLRALAIQVSGIPVPNGPIHDRRYQKEADRITKAEFVSEREQLRADLDVVIERNADEALIQRLNTGARMIQLPQFQGNTVGFHYMVEDLSAALCYAVRLLLLPNGTHFDDLHCCQWPPCGRYFLASDLKPSTGRPRTKYCSDEHMLEAHTKAAAGRTSDSRAGISRRSKES